VSVAADPSMGRSGRYTAAEELANSLTHGLGLALSLAGLVFLVESAGLRGEALPTVGCAVFGASLVLLYASSTLYHSLPSPRAKRVLRPLDHSAIFLLIAGTYTPFTLVTLRGAWGWWLFGVVWSAALAGITLRLVLPRRPTALFLSLYLAMGWCVVVAAHPLFAAIGPSGTALLAAGGLAYSLGVPFYVWRRMPYHHAVWHLFVLAGSALHYAAVLRFVARV
jgi:hemolysin III